MHARDKIIAGARELEAAGLNRGSSGNLSVRRDGGLWLTPSAVPAKDMVASDIVAMTWDANWSAAPGRRPSSEWRIHRDVFAARPEFGAIVHAHPINATALAVHSRPIPAFHYMVALAGGNDVPCAAYATFGTAELSDAVLAALSNRRACLMAHHGLLACGKDLTSAISLAVEIEVLAAQYIAACALGEPPCLNASEMAEVHAKLASGPGYGSLTADIKAPT